MTNDKNIKHFLLQNLAIFISLLMVLSFSGTVFAADTEITEVSCNIADISFAGLKKASSFTVSSDELTTDVKGLAVYHRISATSKDVAICSGKTVLIDGILFINNAKFTAIPESGDSIILKNKTSIFVCSIGSNEAAAFSNSNASPAPVPVITASGTGKSSVLTIKSAKGNIINFYTSASAQSPSTSYTMTAASAKVSLASIFAGQDLSNVLTNGLLYADCENPSFSKSSIKVPVYINKNEKLAAATPVAAANVKTNCITLKARYINDMTIKLFPLGSTASCTVPSDAISIVNATAVVIDLAKVFGNSTEYGKISSAMNNNEGIKKMYFSIHNSEFSESYKSNLVSITYLLPTNKDPSYVSGYTDPVVIRNSTGTADKITFGSIPVKSKIMFFDLTSAQVEDGAVSSLRAITEINSSGKYKDDDEKLVSIPSYFGNVTAAASKQTTVTLDLATYVGHTFMFYIIPNGADTGYWISKSYVIPSERSTGGCEWNVTLDIYYTYGNSSDSMIVYGAASGDTITLYSSTSKKSKAVKVKDNYTLIDGLKISDGYDQISISRAGYYVMPKADLNFTHKAGTYEQLRVSLSTEQFE